MVLDQKCWVVFILLFPAIVAIRKKMILFYSGAIAIFIIANLVLFQPNPIQ